jgi:hypothetical protein
MKMLTIYLFIPAVLLNPFHLALGGHLIWVGHDGVILHEAEDPALAENWVRTIYVDARGNLVKTVEVDKSSEFQGAPGLENRIYPDDSISQRGRDKLGNFHFTAFSASGENVTAEFSSDGVRITQENDSTVYEVSLPPLSDLRELEEFDLIEGVASPLCSPEGSPKRKVSLTPIKIAGDFIGLKEVN